jgi:hypothetical protein
MFTSFGALVYIGLKFNERRTTLAVFLKETTLGLQMSNANPGIIGTKLKGSPNIYAHGLKIQGGGRGGT